MVMMINSPTGQWLDGLPLLFELMGDFSFKYLVERICIPFNIHLIDNLFN